MYKITIKKLTNTKNNRKIFRDFDEKLAIHERTLDSKLLASERIIYNDIPRFLQSPRAAVFAAYSGKNPIGHIAVKIMKQPAWYGGGFYGYIETMYIDEDLRGKGMATKLFLEAKKWLKVKGVKQIKLKVFSNNMYAIKLYKKWGFENIVSEMRLDSH